VTLLSGEDWTGHLLLEKDRQAMGIVNGYVWLLKVKENTFLIEIAEDKSIEATDLPLVGFGCSGWLYESERVTLPKNENEFVSYINDKLTAVFSMFKKNQLRYLPAVSCPCSE